MTMSELFYILIVGFIIYNVVKNWNKPGNGNGGPPWIRNNRKK